MKKWLRKTGVRASGGAGGQVGMAGMAAGSRMMTSRNRVVMKTTPNTLLSLLNRRLQSLLALRGLQHLRLLKLVGYFLQGKWKRFLAKVHVELLTSYS